MLNELAVDHDGSILAERRQIAFPDDAAGTLDDRHAVAQALRRFEHMRRQEHRPSLRGKPAQPLFHQGDAGGIDRLERFVEEEDVRAWMIAAAKATRFFMPALNAPSGFLPSAISSAESSSVTRRLVSSALDPVHLRLEREKLVGVQIVEQPQILRHDANPALEVD